MYRWNATLALGISAGPPFGRRSVHTPYGGSRMRYSYTATVKQRPNDPTAHGRGAGHPAPPAGNDSHGLWSHSTVCLQSLTVIGCGS
jgi:hypothetical protein